MNLLYTNKGFSLDFLLNGNKRRDVMGEDMLARHTLNSGMTEISQHNRALVHVNRGTVRLGMDYTFANEDKLSLAYYLKEIKSYRTVMPLPHIWICRSRKIKVRVRAWSVTTGTPLSIIYVYSMTDMPGYRQERILLVIIRPRYLITRIRIRMVPGLI